MKSLLLSSLLISSLFISSCIVGDEGPAGPPGRDGTVEIYTSTIQIQASDFVIEDEYISVAEYGWDNLDVATVDEGLVLGYIRFEGTTAWQSLPLSVPFESDLVVLRYSFDIETFNLIVEGEIANNNAANAQLFDGDVLRVVAIPPSRLKMGKGIDYTNYEQVVDAYGIKF
ncbi:hypothetical protein AB2B38_001890 [Balneola sp. MJW-20]|uniref:hypothetical protein n=1 Tax=Gracilimonas aurantiaca TaxID=3234185 RepID=UPI0034671F84